VCFLLLSHSLEGTSSPISAVVYYLLPLISHCNGTKAIPGSVCLKEAKVKGSHIFSVFFSSFEPTFNLKKFFFPEAQAFGHKQW